VAFSPDGKTLSSSSADSSIRTWNAAGKHENIQQLSQHSNLVIGIDFNPQTSSLASASLDGTVKLWDYKSP
jgi:WD40 repeat protein